jgi:DNA-binding MarR family transcriptional regulator
MERDDKSEKRSARLLPARQRILFQIYKQGPLEYNITQLSKDLGYQKSGWTSDLIHEFIEKGYVVVISKKGRQLIKITRKGKRQIRHLLLPRALVLAMFAVSLLPLFWAVDELILHASITPLTFIVASISLAGLAYWLFRQLSYVDKELLSRE